MAAFRQPKIQLRLPSGGRWWPSGSIAIPETNEVPVYSMTGSDEILIKTADALLNGSATVNMIQSCIPAIKDAWKTPKTDVDTILIGIRIATYGGTLDMEAKCPQCSELNTYEVNLGQLLDQIKTPDYSSPWSINGITFKLRPTDYKQHHDSLFAQFEQNRMIDNLTNLEMTDPTRIAQIESAAHLITVTTVGLLSKSIESISFNGVVVEDQPNIINFLENADRIVYTSLLEKIQDLNKAYEMPTQHVVCNECKHEHDTSIEFDPSSFFGDGS